MEASVDFRPFFYTVLAFMGVSLLLAMLLLGFILWRVKRINLPPNATFMTALRATPLSVVIFLDLLDFGLDIFGAPVAWVVLSRLGLAPLRGVTMVEQLLPGTQVIPLMTLAWLVARFSAHRQ
jgi:hypothetical protein